MQLRNSRNKPDTVETKRDGDEGDTNQTGRILYLWKGITQQQFTGFGWGLLLCPCSVDEVSEDGSVALLAQEGVSQLTRTRSRDKGTRRAQKTLMLSLVIFGMR